MCLQADVTFIKGWIAMFDLIAELLQQEKGPDIVPTARQLKVIVSVLAQNPQKTGSRDFHANYMSSYLAQGGRQVPVSSHCCTDEGTRDS